MKQNAKIVVIIFLLIACIYAASENKAIFKFSKNDVSSTSKITINGKEVQSNGENVIIINGKRYFAEESETEKKDEVVITKVLDVDKFDKISINGSLNVDVIYGKQQKVEVTGPSNVIDDFEYKLWEKELILKSKGGNSVTIINNNKNSVIINGKMSDFGKVKVKIQTPYIAGCTIVGSGHVSMGKLDIDKFELNIQGSGDFISKANYVDVIIRVQGSGDAKFKEGLIESAKITVNGSGDVSAKVANNCMALVNGSGDIKLFGKPSNLMKSVNGSGDISIY